ncbi:MAG: hypothetical protein ABIL70_08545 [candidate division WOR-3 bacterium]
MRNKLEIMLLVLFIIFTINCWELGHIGQHDIQSPTPEEMIGWVNYPEVFPTCMTDDLQGNIWMGGEVSGTEGLFRFDGENWQRIPASVISISEPVFVSDVYGADNGKLYVGFKDQGFAIYDGTIWRTYNKQSGLVSDSVTVIRIDKSSKIWIGTKSGLTRTNLTTWETFTVNDGLPSNKILDLEIDGYGFILCLTDSGFAFYNGNEWQSFLVDTGAIYALHSLVLDRNGRIWFPEQMGVGGKFFIFENGNISKKDIGRSSSVFDFDSKNNIWIAWYGVSKFENNEWKDFYSHARINYNDPRGNCGLLNNAISFVYIDRKNNKWFATNKYLKEFTSWCGTSRYELE